MISFRDFFLNRIEKGGFTTEDALASFLPLVRQVVATHRAGFVAPLQGVENLQVDGLRIFYDESRHLSPSLEIGKLKDLQKQDRRAVEVIGESRVTLEVDKGRETIVSLQIGERGREITRPVYLPGYLSWEHEVGHHDPLTDVFSLGLILASLACGLDLNDPEHLAQFVNRRRNLFDLNRHLHPVLAKAVTRMTELDRHRRPQDLFALLHTLENYRDQDIDFEYDLARNTGFLETDIRGKRRTVLATLQQRLFEISRRNRLLHFRQTMQTVNLSVASVPLSFDVNSIRPEQILTWNGEFHDSVVAGKIISLNKYLRFEEAIYLSSLLDHIRTEARRDQVEFGFAQLRLVLCFLRWSNLKEKPPERFDSPLVLLPVRLVKKKGVRDTYSLEPLSTDAEINPVLRHYFKQLYDIALPEALDLTNTSLEAFHEFLAAKVQASEPAVSVIKIDRPRIHLIHAKAQRRLDQYIQRSRLSGRGIRAFHDLDYSYDKENFHPLGLRLFQTRIRRPETNLEAIFQQVPTPRTFMVPETDNGPVAEQDRDFYSLDEPDERNPYTWEYDLCNVTLGNFRYRKMSLVRDYAALLENGAENPAFDAIFSLQPRSADSTAVELPPLEDRFPVLTCDPTQTSAIARARTGKSYIIQGPPGTGKSQTIANLITDYVSRGQRVLFVCEKRAAIDVVYHRLRQNGLHQLCALIHDSQEDKKEFIMDLKQTYESLLENAGKSGTPAERQRQELLRAVQHDLRPLQHFHDAMCSPPAGSPVPLRRVVRRLVELRDSQPELSPVEKERIPLYAQWCEHRERIERLTAALKELQGEPIFAKHPLKHLTTRLASQERPLEKVTGHLQNAEKLLDSLEKEFQAAGLRPDEYNTLEKSRQIVLYAEQVRFLAEKRLVSLLQAGSDGAKRFAGLVKQYRKRARALEEARLKTKGWTYKLSPPEVANALLQARAFQNTTLAFLKPGWWRLRSTLRRCYDFRSHQIKPSWTQVLEWLASEYRAEQALGALENKARHVFKLNESAGDFVRKVHDLRKSVAQLPGEVQSLQRRLLAGGKASAALLGITRLKPKVDQLAEELAGFLDDCTVRTFTELRDEFALIDELLDDLPNFLVCLSEAAGLPRELLDVLRRLPLTVAELEAAMAARTWDEACRADRSLSRFSAQVRGRHVHHIQKSHDQLYGANASVVCDRARQRFLEHVRVSGLPHAQLTAEQKEFKTTYNRGRRELEHEFGKTMRYRSIRDLVAGDSGLVIQGLKPVWLMSPLSVSDALPLDTAHFDVVIFDEASQVTLEQAVPSLFRALQAIVVGDQMQLPPTNFFSAKHVEEDELLLIQDEPGGEQLEYDLESNSFLAHAARVLPSTMLGWHYRSRSESLISYSNAAFYQGKLLTVPDKMLPSPQWKEIRVATPQEGTANVDGLLERPVSFHFLQNGVYLNRRNAAEADYIARLVRELLSREKCPSIGIIAFSEAQQGEIEDALKRLGQEDSSFRDRLEAEFEREENGQFIGLLVKNLENIQGDERDIILLSVCYGRGPNGKMLMNFGPINQSGGEKRLNVAFSRAKQHMALISSIRYSEITNDYNDGARCLKNYLRYAQAVSVGDLDTARRTLREILGRPEDATLPTDATTDVVVNQLAGALREHGYEVDLDVGQSSFRCDLAVRRPDEPAYRAGILVDTDAYYKQNDLLERDVMRPSLLQGFGWRIKHVLAKDWYQNRSSTLESLLRFLEKNSDEEKDETYPSEAAAPGASDPAKSEPREPAVTSADPNDRLAKIEVPSPTPLPASSPTPLPRPPVSGGENGKRYFEFSGGTSHKFWEITVNGSQHTVRFGRIGSAGQQRMKSFADAALAERDAQRLIGEKLAKGYVEVR
jgi:predicted DNA-binding WGR domain protein